MVKGLRNDTKQTVQFKLEYAMIFLLDAKGCLRQPTFNALDKVIVSAEGPTLKLDNQKNGWKGVCVYQEHNGYQNFSPVKALGRRCVSIRQSMSNKKTCLSAYWVGGKRKYLTAENMSTTLEFASTALNYSSLKGIPVERVDTH